jgi:hypothetical protein
MTYTKKMYAAVRRETAGKHNLVTDLLDEIDRLNVALKSAEYILEAAAKDEKVFFSAKQWLELHSDKKVNK